MLDVEAGVQQQPRLCVGEPGNHHRLGSGEIQVACLSPATPAITELRSRFKPEVLFYVLECIFFVGIRTVQDYVIT